VLRTVVTVLNVTAVAHPRDWVMRPISVAAVRFPRLIVIIDAAATLGAIVRGAPVGRRDGLAGFARRRAGAATRLGGRHRRLLALAGPTGALGDRLDDLGVRRPGVPRP
jgi:hypothetical protein